MQSVIGCDMDGVIADFVGFALEKVNSKWDLDIKKEELDRPRLGREVSERLEKRGIVIDPEEVYDYLASYNVFENLEVLEGSQEAVKEIASNNKVIFVTKALEWNNCPGEKKRWLDKYFGDINYSLIVVSRFEDKGLLNVDFMIDDDPRTLNAIKMAVPIAIKQPWNEKFLLNNQGIARADSIADVPKMINYFQQQVFCF